MAFYTTGQLMAQLSVKTGNLLKNILFSEILEEN